MNPTLGKHTVPRPSQANHFATPSHKIRAPATPQSGSQAVNSAKIAADTFWVENRSNTNRTTTSTRTTARNLLPLHLRVWGLGKHDALGISMTSAIVRTATIKNGSNAMGFRACLRSHSFQSHHQCFPFQGIARQPLPPIAALSLPTRLDSTFLNVFHIRISVSTFIRDYRFANLALTTL